MNIDEIYLVEPSLNIENEILKYRDECIEVDGRVHGDGGLCNEKSFSEWLLLLDKKNCESTVPQGLVPSSTFFALRKKDGIILGVIDIRHRLNDYLFERGGHIGYSIRPIERNKGYGKAMLKLALQKCRELEMKRVLITCDDDNIASAKTAMACGGIEEFTELALKEKFRRFWIVIN